MAKNVKVESERVHDDDDGAREDVFDVAEEEVWCRVIAVCVCVCVYGSGTGYKRCRCMWNSVNSRWWRE